MEKYKRFKKELVDDKAIQEFLDKITTEGWKIIYYDEKPYGGMEIMQVIIVGEKSSEIK